MKQDQRYRKREILRNPTLDFKHEGNRRTDELVIAEGEKSVNSPFLNTEK